MEICLDLSRHCIQTAARLKLEHLIRQCLKAPDQETEKRIEVLTEFLSQNDFGRLRRRIDLAQKSFGDSPEPLTWPVSGQGQTLIVNAETAVLVKSCIDRPR